MKRIPWLVGVGLAIGLPAGVFAPTLSDSVRYGAQSAYDSAFPVLEARAEITHKTPSEWLIVMYSNKYRDCQLIEVQAYDQTEDDEVKRLTFRREDGAAPSRMPPGKFRSATYVITPPPAHELHLEFLHQCDNRTVRTPVSIK